MFEDLRFVRLTVNRGKPDDCAIVVKARLNNLPQGENPAPRAAWDKSASVDLRQAAEAGLYFLRLLTAAGLPASIAAAYLAQYPLSASSGGSDPAASEHFEQPYPASSPTRRARVEVEAIARRPG